MSALHTVRSRVVVDIDQLSPEVAERYGPFCDMTSNQALLAGAVASDMNVDLVRRVVARARLETTSIEDAVDLALDLLIVNFAKAVLPHLTGRVHAQISPRYAYSSEATLSHGQRLIRLFAREGISHSRVCLKIPTTGAGMIAASQLEKSGIRTLATTLFSVDQALGASQAGCLYIAPYFNELSVHFEPRTWVEYEDPAKEHPMSNVIRNISGIYKRLENKPLIMVASIVNSKEGLAISTLGCDHITMSAKVLEGLAMDQDEADFRGENLGVHVESVGSTGNVDQAHDADWLAEGGKALDESIRNDESVSRRLTYAINAFAECENKVAQVIRHMLL